MRAFAFARRSLARQPGRAALGILGIAAVGALLFDMLLLSRGLVISLRQMLDSTGFDVRVMATSAMPLAGPRIVDVERTLAAITVLPEVEAAIPFRVGQAQATARDGRPLTVALMGAEVRARRPWSVVQGRDLDRATGDAPALLVNRNLADELKLSPGAELPLRGACSSDRFALPVTRFRVAGIAEFPFEEASAVMAMAGLSDFVRACGDEGRDEADLLLVASREGHGPEAAVEAIGRVRPDLHAFTNEQLVARFQQVGFSYFRQISAVLASITLFFGFLLITVLLTVSVNQRLAEIAALRALGFSQKRVIADVLCQSALLVGSGGLLALPLGIALSIWLDAILKSMPGIPANLHFFVFEGRALVLHAALMALTALVAAVYPMRLVARLPIAATLRNEVIS